MNYYIENVEVITEDSSNGATSYLKIELQDGLDLPPFFGWHVLPPGMRKGLIEELDEILVDAVSHNYTQPEAWDE